MLSISVKLQILVILICIFLSLYVFVLQKEVKMVQSDVTAMKKHIDDMSKCCPKTNPPIKLEIDLTADDDEDEDEDEDEDTVSVSSEEIKNIITNISSIDEEVSLPTPVDVELSTMSVEELEKLKYEDLKNYLKSKGVSYKGKKPDLIENIRSLKN